MPRTALAGWRSAMLGPGVPLAGERGEQEHDRRDPHARSVEREPVPDPPGPVHSRSIWPGTACPPTRHRPQGLDRITSDGS
jgi:hypothetical protein